MYNGSMFTASCVAEYFQGLSTELVEIEWLRLNDSFDNSQSVGNIVQLNDTFFERSLLFAPLTLDHSGMYLCTTRVNGEFVFTQSNTTDTLDLMVFGELNCPLKLVNNYNRNYFFSSTDVFG